MRFRYFNPNPIKSSGGDCVVRMLCAVTGKTWRDCFLDLVEKSLDIGDMPSVNATWVSLLYDMGYKRYSLPNSCPDCYTIKDFAIEHPEGVYVVGTGSHVVAVINGKYYDTWDSGDEIPMFYLRR